jgi:hypothetical protein
VAGSCEHGNKRLTPLKETNLLTLNQPSAGTEIPQLNGRGCDNVLLGQGYHTPQRAAIDEYGVIVE